MQVRTSAKGTWKASFSGPKFGYEFNFNSNVERKLCQSDRGPCVSSRITEHFDEEV